MLLFRLNLGGRSQPTAAFGPFRAFSGVSRPDRAPHPERESANEAEGKDKHDNRCDEVVAARAHGSGRAEGASGGIPRSRADAEKRPGDRG